MRVSFQIVPAGNSRRDFEYQEKVFDRILADTGGWKPKQEAEAALLASPQPVIYYIQGKIKQALDPNDISAPGYATLERPPPGGLTMLSN